MPSITTEDDTDSPVFKFLKFCLWAIIAVYCAATVVVVLVLRYPPWHPYLVRFIYRTWLVFVAEKVGSTSPGFVNYLLLAIVTLLIGLVGVWHFQGFGAMRKNIWETVAIGVVGLVTALFLVFGTQFVWEVVKSGFVDHQVLAAKANAPKPSCPTCVSCATCPPQNAPKPPNHCWMNYQAQLADASHPQAKSSAALLIFCNYTLNSPTVGVAFDKEFTDGWMGIFGQNSSIANMTKTGTVFSGVVSTPPKLTAGQAIMINVQGTTEQAPKPVSYSIR